MMGFGGMLPIIMAMMYGMNRDGGGFLGNFFQGGDNNVPEGWPPSSSGNLPFLPGGYSFFGGANQGSGSSGGLGSGLAELAGNAANLQSNSSAMPGNTLNLNQSTSGLGNVGQIRGANNSLNTNRATMLNSLIANRMNRGGY